MMPMMKAVKAIRRAAWRGLVLLIAAMTLASCGWRGIANVPLPGGPGTGANKMTIYVQMPDTLALNVNSKVRVADVNVGSVRKIELKNWIATLTLDMDAGVQAARERHRANRSDESAGQPAHRTRAAR